MSSLWTPDGERPVPPRTAAEGTAPAGAPPDEVEIAEQMAAMRAELINSPVEVVIANHCYGLFELAAVYLSNQPAMLDQARLAIDALGSMLDGLEGRLGDVEPQLKEGLSQLRLAYVQIDGAARAGAEVASGSASNGGASEPAGKATEDEIGNDSSG